MDKLFLEDELSSVIDAYARFTNRYMHPPKLQGIRKRGRFLYENFYRSYKKSQLKVNCTLKK